jgi:hypothetical protein
VRSRDTVVDVRAMVEMICSCSFGVVVRCVERDRWFVVNQGESWCEEFDQK